MRSYGYVKENEITLHMADYIPHFNPMERLKFPRATRDITLHDGSTIRLETISAEHDPGDAMAALTALHTAETGKTRHGLLYFDASSPRWPKTSAWLTRRSSTSPMKRSAPTKLRLTH